MRDCRRSYSSTRSAVSLSTFGIRPGLERRVPASGLRSRLPNADSTRHLRADDDRAPLSLNARPTLAGLVHVLPVLHWMPRYERSWLSRDAIAAVSIWALLVPQSLAYSSIAGVPVQYGLYTAFAALFGYALFGTSKQMAQGPSAAVAAVVGAVITPLVGAAALGTDDAAKFAAALALATGLVYVALGAAAHGLGVELPVQGGDGRIRPRLRDRHHHRADPQAPRRAEGGRKLHASSCGAPSRSSPTRASQPSRSGPPVSRRCW